MISDHLGTPRLVVDQATGAVVERLDVDEWGNVLSDSNPGWMPFGFDGGIADAATGLVRFGARDLDPRSGRWTAKDPIGFAGRSANLFGFAKLEPIDYRDPDGSHNITVSGDDAPEGYVDYVNALLGALDKTPSGSRLLNRVDRNGGAEIVFEAGQCHAAGNKISFDPSKLEGIPTKKGCAQAAPIGMLAHELGHVGDPFGVNTDLGPNGTAGSNILNNEDPVEHDFGLPERNGPGVCTIEE